VRVQGTGYRGRTVYSCRLTVYRKKMDHSQQSMVHGTGWGQGAKESSLQLTEISNDARYRMQEAVTLTPVPYTLFFEPEHDDKLAQRSYIIFFGIQ
jgi:hypothetical protein